jgi:hypothetical protein
MKAMNKSWKQLFNDCVLLILVFGTVGIALKFATFFDRWVYFPAFPNALDATFLILSVMYLLWRIKK